MSAHGCEFHPDLYYDAEFQIWVRPESDGTASVGMTDISQTIAGKVQVALANLRRLAQPLSATLLTDFYLAPPQLSGNAARLGLAQIGMRLIADRFHVYLRDESGIAALFAEAGWNVSSIARPARDQHYRRGPVPLRRDLLCIVEARPA